MHRVVGRGEEGLGGRAGRGERTVGAEPGEGLTVWRWQHQGPSREDTGESRR